MYRLRSKKTLIAFVLTTALTIAAFAVPTKADQTLAERYRATTFDAKGRKLAVLGVDIDTDPDKGDAAVAKLGLAFPIVCWKRTTWSHRPGSSKRGIFYDTEDTTCGRRSP